jgi:hypothetical protein
LRLVLAGLSVDDRGLSSGWGNCCSTDSAMLMMVCGLIKLHGVAAR